MDTIRENVLDRIRSSGRGAVFTPKDFLDIGSRDAADQALSRLSTQVPAKPVYLSDGRARKVRVGNFEFQLKHASPKEMPAGNRTSAMVFQALRYIGKEAVDGRVVGTLRRAFSVKQLRELLSDAKYTTDWIGDVVRLIAARPKRKDF